mgnify:CR=1 FL=1
MHMVAGRPIELQRVMFVDATFLSDGPDIHTRVAIWFAASKATSTAPASTPTDLDPAGHESSDTATLATPVITNESTSLVLPHRSDKMTQPPKRYSPKLFLIDFGEPTNYDATTRSECFPD